MKYKNWLFKIAADPGAWTPDTCESPCSNLECKIHHKLPPKADLSYKDVPLKHKDTVVIDMSDIVADARTIEQGLRDYTSNDNLLGFYLFYVLTRPPKATAKRVREEIKVSDGEFQRFQRWMQTREDVSDASARIHSSMEGEAGFSSYMVEYFLGREAQSDGKAMPAFILSPHEGHYHTLLVDAPEAVRKDFSHVPISKSRISPVSYPYVDNPGQHGAKVVEEATPLNEAVDAEVVEDDQPWWKLFKKAENEI